MEDDGELRATATWTRAIQRVLAIVILHTRKLDRFLLRISSVCAAS